MRVRPVVIAVPEPLADEVGADAATDNERDAPLATLGQGDTFGARFALPLRGSA